jgi:tetratricopeptide (TPR) repeat protein
MASTAEILAAAARCYQAGRLAEAELLYRQILQAEPDHADALHLLGVLALQSGRHQAAVEYIGNALRLKPHQAAAHANLGTVHAQQGRLNEAVACFRRAVELAPQFAAAHANLGSALVKQGQPAQAEEVLRHALRLQPDAAEAHVNLAVALLEQGKLEEALASCDQALRLRPDLAPAHYHRGLILTRQEKWPEVVACYTQAVRHDPGYADAQNNLGAALEKLGRVDEALAAYAEALRLRPDYPEALNNRGSALSLQSKLEEALASYDMALGLKPDFAEAHQARSMIHLMRGKYEQGWPEFEWRHRCPGDRLPAFAQPAWDGTPLAGRRVLLFAEQGLGDTLQFVRYAPLVKERGGQVILACQRPLLQLLNGCPGIDRLVAREDTLPDFDVYAALLSLPRIFGTTVATVPAPVPYLSADPALVEHWRGVLAPYTGFKIGIAWQGNPRQGLDRHRSFPLACIEPLARVHGVQLFSLQKGHGLEQLHDLHGRFPIIDLGPRLDETTGPFLDTAAVMKNLDLVICPDTSLAHLAGALAVPVWLPLSRAPEWRWLWDRPDTPWYPTMRLFRQERLGDWESVFARIVDALASSRRGLLPPGRPAPAVVGTVAEAMALGWQGYQARDFQAAERAYRSAVATDPGNADAWCFLGIVGRARGDLATAAACYREAVRLRPHFVEATNNLGNVLALQGQPDEAIACFRTVLGLRPDFAEAHNNLGVALRNLGRLDEAVASYHEALRLRPAYADAHNNLGDAFSRLGRLEEAVTHYRQALRLAPNFAAAHNNLGALLRTRGQLAEAADCFRQALRLQPHYAEAQANRASLLAQQGRVDDAVAGLREAIRLKPDFTEAHFHLAQALRAQGKQDEAHAVFRHLLQVPADHPEAHRGRALTWLLLGDYEHGWPEYEWRLRCSDYFHPPWTRPRWDGSPLAGRTILLAAEQGLGDTLQFVRYVPLVKARGGSVVLACQKPLLGLLAGCPGIDRLVTGDDDLPAFDVHAALLSLPALFGTTLATVPASVPYLSADPDLVAHWRRELAAYPGVKVGIAWQGNPEHRADCYRSFRLADFEPLARVPGVQLFSLQKGPGTEQLRARPFPVIDLGSQLDEQAGAFQDTAAVMKNLDLVITVDTVHAHLAGALAVPVWVVLSAAADVRWLLDREDTPWYPTLRLFRQRACGEAGAVFARVAAALRQQAAACAPLVIELAPGELIDKILQLQIERERLRDAGQLRHLCRELELLEAAQAENVPPSDELDRLTAELRGAHETLRQVEDDLRLCEKAGDLGPRFVALARSLLRTNDRCAAQVRRINALFGPEIIEEPASTAAPHGSVDGGLSD